MGKKKNRIPINAIDKYLKQMKYRTEFKKPGKTKIRQPKIVIPRIKSKRFHEFTDANIIFDRNENPSFSIKVPVVKLKPALKPMKVKSPNFHPEKITHEPEAKRIKKDVPLSTMEVNVPVDSNSFQVKNIVNTRSRNLTSNTNFTRNPSNYTKKMIKKKEFSVRTKGKKSRSARLRQEGLKETVFLRGIQTAVQKSSDSVESSRRVRNAELKPSHEPTSGVKPKGRTTGVEKNLIKITKSFVKNRINPAHSDNENVNSAEKKQIAKNRKIHTVLEYRDDSSLSTQPCLCAPLNIDVDDTSEPIVVRKERLISNKYQLCMEEIESLTTESITKYIKDNQQYYSDFRKLKLTRKINTNGKKKRTNEFKDCYKCNPFNSAQQVAMYLALREVFNIPAGSFLECRYFFTLLIPESCCQLFAKIFQIKTSLAAKLIKKLYPNPVSKV